MPHLGTQGYFSLMRIARAMVGNSSSGIIEAASFGLPVVNVGTRQEGRLAPPNVIHVGYERAAILAGIREATAAVFRARCAGMANPYGDGRATPRMLEILKTMDLGERDLIVKRFHELARAGG